MIEKPAKENAPTNLAIMGRYILAPEIFDILETQEEGKSGEIQLTDAINKLANIQNVFGYHFDGKRFDVGEKIGFIKTTLDFALKREDLRAEILHYLELVLVRENA